MFPDRIEAWAYGPVVPEVYTAFRRYSGGPIDASEGSEEGLTSGQKKFIGQVWQAYKGYSALSLSDMTHKEDPWKIARGNLSREARCDRPISHQSMRQYFSALAKS